MIASGTTSRAGPPIADAWLDAEAWLEAAAWMEAAAWLEAEPALAALWLEAREFAALVELGLEARPEGPFGRA